MAHIVVYNIVVLFSAFQRSSSSFTIPLSLSLSLSLLSPIYHTTKSVLHRSLATLVFWWCSLQWSTSDCANFCLWISPSVSNPWWARGSRWTRANKDQILRQLVVKVHYREFFLTTLLCELSWLNSFPSASDRWRSSWSTCSCVLWLPGNLISVFLPLFSVRWRLCSSHVEFVDAVVCILLWSCILSLRNTMLFAYFVCSCLLSLRNTILFAYIVILPPLLKKHKKWMELNRFARVCCIHSDATIQLHLANNKRYLPSQAPEMNHAAQATIGTNTWGRTIVVYGARNKVDQNGVSSSNQSKTKPLRKQALVFFIMLALLRLCCI